jgi:uncharacterized protein
MIVTLDTNVLLSATLWANSEAQKLLYTILQKNILVYTSPDILKEYQKILRRDFTFSDEAITELLQKITLFTKIINPKRKVMVVKDDPDDNKIIECALASQSTHIITYDKHLLHLKTYKQIKIITPKEARKSIL